MLEEKQEIHEDPEEAIRKAVKANSTIADFNAITSVQIDAWKAEYGPIFSTTIGDQTFIWHKLRRKDYVSIMKQTGMDPVTTDPEVALFERQDKIAETVIIWPDQKTVAKLLEENGGYSSAIADEVMIHSGFRRTSTNEL